jgi:POT family proton-dependent oligopeptide transporter
MPNVHGSADITADSNLESRLVIPLQTRNTSDDTDACASLSLPKTEQDSVLSSEIKDHVALNVTRSVPTPSDDDDGRMATEDEVRDLLHVVDRIPVRLWVACLAGILERFVWYGATAPLRAWYLLIYNVL